MQFVDTNILLYAISREPAEQGKAKCANDILVTGDLALSVQVLKEFYVQATRASRPDAIAHRQKRAAMGCAEVLSEDLDDGHDYAGVQVTNPFRDSGPG